MRGRFRWHAAARVVFLLSAGLSIGATASARPAAVQVCWPTDQVMRGATVYTSECAVCHRPSLVGDVETPSLGDALIGRWMGAPVTELQAYIQRAMPQMAPGTLSQDDAKAVTAFLLSRNAVPRGRTVRPASRIAPTGTSACNGSDAAR